jgi:DeoR/GlpR family transcriptional regulator of sugar metabolism
MKSGGRPTKTGKNSFASRGDFLLINYLITDSLIKPEDIEQLKTHDVQFVIADND